MVKLTIIGRLRDALPLAKGPTYVHQLDDDENDMQINYKKQLEFILKEISRGDLYCPNDKITIRVDHHCFRILVANGVCFMVLCDSSYPRKLAFHYLNDLRLEFDRLDRSLVERVVNPYSFVRLDSIIGGVRRRYVDTRTQSNILKMKSKSGHDHIHDMTEDLQEIVNRRRRLDMLETMMRATLSDSPIWSSEKLEIIALRWIPISILVVTGVVLLWSSSVINDEFRY